MATRIVVLKRMELRVIRFPPGIVRFAATRLAPLHRDLTWVGFDLGWILTRLCSMVPMDGLFKLGLNSPNSPC